MSPAAQILSANPAAAGILSTAHRRRVLLIKYHMRLGDIIRCLPIAKWYADQGWAVLFECLPQYHGIFEAVSYAVPVDPAGESHAEVWVDKTLDLQIWPKRYQAFRNSGKTWMDYVYSLRPEFADISRAIIFDRVAAVKGHEGELALLPPDVSLVAPFGYSNVDPPRLENVLALASGLMHKTSKETWILADAHQAKTLRNIGRPVITVKNVGLLPLLIQSAADFLTVNSAPAIIAGAMRSSYWHVPTAVYQDDWVTPNRKVVRL